MLPNYSTLETGATLITAVAEINQWHIYSPDSPEPQILEMQTVGQATDYMDRLSSLVMAAGSGEHPCRDLRVASGLTVSQISSYAQSLAAIIPELVQSTRGKDSAGGASRIGLADMTLAMRHATPDERAVFDAKIQEAGGEALMYAKNKVQAADAEKVQLGSHDHAIITFQGQKFVLDLASHEAIIAVRLFEYIAAHPDDDKSESYVGVRVWRSLTIAERMLFSDAEKTVYGDSARAISAVMRQALRGLSAALGMTRSGNNYIRTTRDPIGITLEPLPPEEPYDNSFRLISPPGMDKEVAARFRPNSLSGGELRAATKYLELSADQASVMLTHEAAIELLDSIMGDRTKHALRTAMGHPTREQLVEVLDGLHAIVQRSLGWTSYNAAYHARTISGTAIVSKGGRVMQVGGEMSKNTTKWFIGAKRGDLSSYKDKDHS